MLPPLLPSPPASRTEYRVPAGREPARVVPGGTSILPNGRFVTPTGRRLWTGGNLWKVLVRENDGLLVGFAENELAVYSRPDSGAAPRRIVLRDLAPAGCFLTDGRLAVSLGDQGKVAILDANTFAVVATIPCGADSHVVDLAARADGSALYALDVANQKLLVLDPKAGTLLAKVPAGRQPYALTLAPNGRALFVANIGLFDYSLVPQGVQPDPRGLSRPAFAYPSREARDGGWFEGRAVPGLGDSFVPDAQSVWRYDLSRPLAPAVVAKAKTGLLIRGVAGGGESKAVGGSAPNAVLATETSLWVSNANNDTVQEFSSGDLKLKRTVRLSVGRDLVKFRGIIPTGLALDRTRGRLYVAEAGLNSVAALDVRTGVSLGRFPVGWFPTSLALTPSGTLAVAAQKGLGRGPKGIKSPPPAPERVGFGEMPGLVSLVPPLSSSELIAGDRRVRENDGFIPIAAAPRIRALPLVPGVASPVIRHVVFITKENHTFDGIFGGLTGAVSEPDYAEFGRSGWIREKGKGERLTIMPNHLRLAERFAIGDNFYMEPQASGDGHRWLVGVYPSIWTSRVFYAGWDFRRSETAKGRLVSFGSNGSQIPEDYLENGSLWEHLDRGRVTFRNYGEGFEFPGVGEDEPATRSGASEAVNFPMPKALYDNTCFDFPIFNTNIPDIARVDWFKEDMERYRRAHRGELPGFTNIALCNDHGDRPRPKAGYPYVCSYMADNDLALGRLVEYLTHLPEWRSTAIFVTQDDSGGDDDSVDRHRSFVLLLSPWAKRGYVGHDHTSIMSILRTIYASFGLGPNNLFDATAIPLTDLFGDRFDPTPYTAVPVDPRVFKPEETLDPADPGFKRRRTMRSVRMDDPAWFEWLRQGRG